MSSRQSERLTSRESLDHSSLSSEFGTVAVKSSVEIDTPAIPREPLPYAKRIAEVKNLPHDQLVEEIKHLDIDLREITECVHQTWDVSTEEVPPQVVELVDDAASILADNLEPESHSLATIDVMVDAFVITQDTELIEKVTELVETHPQIAGFLHKEVTNGLRYAAEHAHELDATFKVIAPIKGQPSLDTPAITSEQQYKVEDANKIVPMSRRPMPASPDEYDAYLTRPFSREEARQRKLSLQNSEAIDMTKTVEAQLLDEAKHLAD